MKQLIYASRPTNEVEPQLIRDILDTSYKMNADHGISGMLVCDGKYFLQCIEGNAAAIDQLYSNICKDDRHYDVNIIGEITIDQKDFEAWEMGYISNKQDILDVLKDLTLANDFTPYEFTFLEAKSILKRLASYL